MDAYNCTFSAGPTAPLAGGPTAPPARRASGALRCLFKKSICASCVAASLRALRVAPQGS